MTQPTRPPGNDAILARLTALHPRKIDLSLGRIERLLARLGHPERKLPLVVHVAGTNGKGSVVATMAAIARAAGLRAHVYTSPHLVRFNERIRPAGREISDRALSQVLTECERANAGAPITFFEITTAAAYLAFSRAAADLTLLEAGLGGRLDATGVIARPAVSAITPVALDHQRFLGRRLADIATEKAGILKRGVPAVIGPQHPNAARVIAARAKELSAPLVRFGHEFDAHALEGKDRFRCRDAAGERDFPLPALAGVHQVANAAIAIAALGALGSKAITDAAIARGLVQTAWPARLQRLGRGPLTGPATAQGFEVLLDGGHNPHAARALAATLRTAPRPLELIVGMLRQKDSAGFLRPFRGLARRVWTVPVPGTAEGRAPEETAALARRLGFRARPAASVEAALAAIVKGAKAPGRILIAGSLYLAGAVLAENAAPKSTRRKRPA